MLVQIACVFLLLWTLLSRWKQRRMINLANQLKSRHLALPIVGHAYMFLGNAKDRMTRLQMLGEEALERGGLLSHWQGNQLFVLLADPEAAEVVLKTCLEKDDTMRFLRSVIGNGSIFAPVALWRPRRKILAPTFSTKTLYHFVEIFSRQSSIMTDMLQKSVGRGPVSVWRYFTSYTMDSVCETTLGSTVNAQSSMQNSFLHAFEECCRIDAARVFQPWFYNDTIYRMLPQHREHSRHKKIIRDFIEEIISKKLEESKTDKNMQTNKDGDGLKTFLELLIETAHGNNIYNSVELEEETLVLVLAGTDTSAVGASFTTVMLSKHPHVQEKIYEELQDVFGDTNRPVTAEDLPRLKYLEATIKETLRLYPPVPFIVRKVEKDIPLPSGVTLVKGCGAFISIWSLHRNRRYWGEDADQFRPERFIDSAPKHPVAFIPFSHGPRSCLGHQYAMMSMKTALACLLRQYRIKPLDNDDPKKLLRVKFDIMLRHVDNFVVQLESRI